MNIANFLYRKTGRNIYKPVASSEISSVAEVTSSPLALVNDQPEIDTTIHIGPRGGHYRLNAKGRKIYLRSA